MGRRPIHGVVRLAAVGLGASLAVGFGSLGIAIAQQSPTDAVPGANAIPVTMAQAARQDVPIFAVGIGTVQAFQSVLIQARVTGWLNRIAFAEGQEVKPGDLLAEIDPRPYAATLAQAQAK